MSTARGTLLVALVALAPAVAAGAAPATPRALAPAVVKRFLRSYGYAGALAGEEIVRADGTRVALSSIRDHAQLYALTAALPRASFAGLAGLSSERPAMKTVLTNLDAAGQAPRGAARFTTALREGDLVAAHHEAVHDTGARASQVARRFDRLAQVYLAAGAPAEARLLARKLGRVAGGQVPARLAEITIAAQRGDSARAGALMQALHADEPARADVTAAHAALLETWLERPAEALAMARRALAQAPHDPEVVAVAASALRYAASKDLYRDAAGRSGSAAAGYAEALQHFRRAGARDVALVATDMTDLVVPTSASEAATKGLLERANAAFDRGDLAGAERLGRAVVATDRDHALGYRVVGASIAARRDAGARRLRGNAVVPAALQTPEAQAAIVAQARALGIAAIVPAFDAQPPARQAVIAYSTLPLRRFWPRLVTAGAKVEVLPLHEPLQAYVEGLARDQRTFDGRYWYGIRGLGSPKQAVVASYELGHTENGRFAVLAHEFAHLVHEHLSPAQKRRVTMLFKQGKALDDYAASDAHEYFAQGYEASLAERKDATSVRTHDNTLARLEARDPALLAFIRSLQ